MYLSTSRSYRTYEEWKQFLKENAQENEVGSYRTYEEWKHDDIIINWTRNI